MISLTKEELDRAFDNIKEYIVSAGCGSPGCMQDRKVLAALYIRHGLEFGSFIDFLNDPRLKISKITKEYEWNVNGQGA